MGSSPSARWCAGFGVVLAEVLTTVLREGAGRAREHYGWSFRWPSETSSMRHFGFRSTDGATRKDVDYSTHTQECAAIEKMEKRGGKIKVNMYVQTIRFGVVMLSRAGS